MTPDKDNSTTIGVMLLAFGGPDSLDSVEPFMERLMKGRKPTPEIIARAKDKYKLIGGKSPLNEITQRQADALQLKLNEICNKSLKFKTYVGMRYWHPFIEETIEQMISDGIKRAFAISMSPHSSQVSTGAYTDEINRVVSEKNLDIQIEMIKGMHKNPIFIDAVVERINDAIARFPKEKRDDIQVIFSSHSLPVAYIEAGDTYVDELRVTIEEVLKKTGSLSWHLAYQSKGSIPGDWLGPMVEDVLQDIAEAGYKEVLLVPIGFASDHMETLWDLDILHKKQAESLGLKCERSDALNDSPKFIEALASMVCKQL
ncbi:MAG: ferrochelatase [Firmicutes bacterium]|nr:ferrochelatase [Bacillota bacterium]